MFELDPNRLSFFILTYPIFLLALSFHEMAHAISAKWGGDLTSAYQGRVTMNPLAHIDPIGTVLMPALMAISTGIPLIGWAKPVPVVDVNFRRGDSYGVIVALAGPFSNLLLAFASVVLLQFYYVFALLGWIPDAEWTGYVRLLLFYSIQINIFLMIFNLIPVPPLDGSHVLWHWFVKRRPAFHEAFHTARQYGFLILIALIYFNFLTLWFGLFGRPLVALSDFLSKVPLYFF